MRHSHTKHSQIAVLTLFLFGLGSCGDPSATQAVRNGGDAAADQADRALSLRVLQKHLKQCTPEGSCQDAIKYVAGITHIQGYTLDRENRDVVLLGRGDASKRGPLLHVDDFVVALRNAYLRYAELKDRTYYYEPPGCSIDPDPKVVERLRQTALPAAVDEGIAARAHEVLRWQRVAESPQAVRLLGVPPSHFAAVMVDADYLLKRIVNGTYDPGVAGIESLMAMRVANARRANANGDAEGEHRHMTRFWFHPADPVDFVEDGDTVLLDHLGVVVKTEEEHLHNGEIKGSGRSDETAALFCRHLNERYRELKRARGVYADLENLYRWVALAQLMHHRKALQTVGLDLSFLLDEYPIGKVDVPSEVPGLTQITSVSLAGDPPSVLQMATSGGVGIGVKVEDDMIRQDDSGVLATLEQAARTRRPSPAALFWLLFGALA